MSHSNPSPLPSGSAADLRQDAAVIGLIGLSHLISHFSQLLLPPLFPWLKEALGASYAELGGLMSAFFVVSCVAQALSGFAVDRFGPRPVLFAGLLLLGLSAFGFALSNSYIAVLLFSLLAGVGNGVFHPVNYTLINRRVSAQRLGHAYSVHGISGNLGWALAPAMLVPLTLAYSWRVALGASGVLIFSVLALMWFHRGRLWTQTVPPTQMESLGKNPANADVGSFLRIPSIWLSFSFFFFFAMSLSIIQAFAPEAVREFHSVPQGIAAICLSIYMLSAATGMVGGGFLASNPARSEHIVAIGFSVAAMVSLTLGLAHLAPWVVPFLFGVMGLAVGMAGPSRDLLIKQATPAHASGRVYGLVYSGLDIGQALSPLIFGLLMDRLQYRSIFVGLALLQCVLVVNALSMHRASRDSGPGRAA